MVKQTRLYNLMVLHLICCPNAGDAEPISCPAATSIQTFLAKEGLQELMVYLGWKINICLFNISSPPKARAWSNSVKEIIKLPKANFGKLATLVGYL